MRPFNYSAWATHQETPLPIPGKLYDRTDNEIVSGCAVGGPAPYGRVLVRGPGSNTATLTDRHYTMNDAVCLPDADGAHLQTEDGTLWNAAAPAITIPVDANGLMMVQGIGVATTFGFAPKRRLAQPFGLGDAHYAASEAEQVGMAQEGNIVCYCETNINVGDNLFFRTRVTSTSDGLQLLGAFTTVDDANTQAFTHGSVFRPGPAGGAFVLNLNMKG